MNDNHFDVIHAHYSLSAFVASLAGSRPLIVSLMGSDVQKGLKYRIYIHLFAFLFSWKHVIVKTQKMKASLKMDRAIVLPNGVDLQRFHEMEQKKSQNKLDWNERNKHILFPANISRPEKNYRLFNQATKKLVDDNVVVHWFNEVSNAETPYWYNAADVVVMTSLREGSPNVIKESMACGRPIVSVDVGDVKELFGNTEGCYIAERNPEDIAAKIQQALSFKGKTNGRQRIIDLGLSNDLVAKRLIAIYEEVLKGCKS